MRGCTSYSDAHAFRAFCVFVSGNHLVGIWQEMENIKDPELRKKALHLPTVIQSAWADSTNKRYDRGWKQWMAWCKKYPEFTGCPAAPFYVVLFINDLVVTAATLGTI